MSDAGNDSDAAGVEDDRSTDDAAHESADPTQESPDEASANEAAGEESAGDETEDEMSDTTTDEPDESAHTDLVSQVAEYDETLAASVERLDQRAQDRAARIEELDAELTEATDRVEQLESQLARTKADFENYKDRAKRKQADIRERATEDLVERLTEVRNNLVRALDQEADADIRPGVESTLETFDRVLREEGVETIEPEPGAEVDPNRHRVMMRVESEQPPGTVAELYQPGYEMAGSVVEPAQVTVSDDE